MSGRTHLFASMALTLVLLAAASAWADGVYFIEEFGTAANLAQTRQEAVLAVHDDRVTYVLQTRYSGQASGFAWVLPLPAAATDVTAHDDDTLFDQLAAVAAPSFTINFGVQSGKGCGCAGGLLNQVGDLVDVEATGQAGIFDWASLTSTGSSALRTWLNDNGFSVPASADPILDTYIQQRMHFLAVRVREPQSAVTDGQVDIPPLQFTCQTARLFYPMAISQISAAGRVEVILYVIDAHRVRAANLPNATIDPAALVYDAASPSLTNYETLVHPGHRRRRRARPDHRARRANRFPARLVLVGRPGRFARPAGLAGFRPLAHANANGPRPG